MKKLVVAIAVGMVCLGAMAQGRVTFSNNSERLVYWDSTKAAITVADAAANHLVADLYVGSAADSLVKALSSTTAWANPGQWTPVTAALPSPFSGGTVTKWYFQVRVSGDNGAFGQSEVFQAFAASSPISANGISITGSPSFSTWLPGTQQVTGAAAGALGSIAVVVPEPATFALAGLGAAALLIFRRRN